MPSKTKPTFEKRNKEMARLRKQQNKEEARAVKREDKNNKPTGSEGGEDPDIAGIIPGPQPPQY